MGRHNFFEAMEKELDVKSEYLKFEIAICEEKYCISFPDEDYESQSINDCIESHFRYWDKRGTFMSFNELRNHLGFKIEESHSDPSIKFPASNYLNINDFFVYCEMIYNITYYFDSKHMLPKIIADSCKVIITTMRADLEKANCEIKSINNKYIICEKNPTATAVAEIVDEKTSEDIIEYNHYLLKSDLKRKRQILTALGNIVEPQRNDIEQLDRNLSNNIFYLLNNFSIRHNNDEQIKKFSDTDLESIYDSLYQLILQAQLLLSNKPFNDRVRTLRSESRK